MQKMSDTSSEESIEGLIGIGIVVTFISLFSVAFFMVPKLFINSTAFFLILVTSLVWVPAVWVIVAYVYENRVRSETTFKGGDVEDKSFGRDVVHYSSLKRLNKDDPLDIYTATLKQVDTVTPIYNVEEVGKYAECPYCGSNIRDTFYDLGGIVRCDKCGALHHKECFEYYGRKCGSPSCKLRNN
ncbi:MAG: hypothetical protein N2V75_05025 [Methanophagales archaeon]|nr:hypothetical protein [Methanophagales archaeon]